MLKGSTTHITAPNLGNQSSTIKDMEDMKHVCFKK